MNLPRQMRHALVASRSRWQQLASERELLARRLNPWRNARPIVTVFGSCRQDSVSAVSPTTAIRDGLTYPHYSKEVLQAIRFVADISEPRPTSLAAFRNTQIGERLVSRRRLHRQFLATDVFIVEIASRLAYEVAGDYWHHHAIDSGSMSEFSDGELRKRRQDDSEVLGDLFAISELLSPKPVVFVTHICTRSEGDRAQLRNLVVEFCHANGAAVIDPVASLGEPIDSLVQPELVLAHFTEQGHARMAEIYGQVIRSVWRP